jgi:hypothetical protein
VIQQRLSGSTTIRAGLGPKNLIGGGLFDPGPGRLVEDTEQGPGVPAGLEGRPPQCRHARHRYRSGDKVQEPAGDGEADPLGLRNGGELLLHVARDLHGALQPLAEGLDLGLLLGKMTLKLVDPGSGRGAVDGLDGLDGLDDLRGLAIERLAGSVAIVGHSGHVAVSTSKDGEGAGNPLGDRGHGRLAPSRPIKGSRPRWHTPRRELSTDHRGSKAVLRKCRSRKPVYPQGYRGFESHLLR